MNIYKNLSRNSGITHYEIGEDYIEIKFDGNSESYIYSDTVTGKMHVEKMKSLALRGEGLNTYINQHSMVKNSFRKRL